MTDRARTWSVHLGVLARTLVARGCGVVDGWATMHAPSIEVVLRSTRDDRTSAVVMLTDRRDLHDSMWRGASRIDPHLGGGTWWWTWTARNGERHRVPGFSDVELVADRIVASLRGGE